VNLQAALGLLLEDHRPIHLVCAGTDGAVTKEDLLFAGAVVRGLALASHEPLEMSDSSDLAVAYFEVHSRSRDDFLRALRTSLGGRNLVELGFDADIDRAGEWDLFDVVPELCRRSGRIQAATVQRPIQERWLVPPA
jgi:2-phosphosulfolactate phosphatase